MGIHIFVKQLALRTSAIFIVKLMGALVRIPLFRLLGAEGVGLYQIAYSFYGLVLTCIIGGFPTALSLLTAKNVKQGKALLSIMLLFLAVMGGGAGFLSYMFAPTIASFMGDQQLTIAIQYIAPALFVVPLLHLFRGFLQGMEAYGYIAGSEIIEQLVRVCTMLGLVTIWAVHGKSWAVSGAIWGAFTGAACALLFLLIPFRLLSRTSGTDSLKQTLSNVFPFFLHSSLAILATRLIVPVSEFLDAIIVPHRLQDGGMSSTQATAVFGEISGMAVTAVYVPTMITAAISHTLAAKIAEDWKRKQDRAFTRRVRLALQLAWGWGGVSVLFLFFYADEISSLLFGKKEAGLAIRYLCAIPLLTGLREITTTVLWAQEKEREPVTGLLMGTVCSITLSYFLTAIPGYGYEGAIIGVLSLEYIAFMWNMKQVKKGNKSVFLVFPALWEGLCIFAAGIVYFFILNRFATLFMYAFPPPVQDAGKMLLFYIGLTIYAGLRFIKKNRLTFFLSR